MTFLTTGRHHRILKLNKRCSGLFFLADHALTTASEKLMPLDFYRASHQRIYEVMLDIGEKGEPVDLVTVTSELQSRKWLDEIGGVAYLSDLADSVPTASNIEYYSRIVEEKALLRRLIRVASDIVKEGYASEEEVDSILDQAEKNDSRGCSAKKTQAILWR